MYESKWGVIVSEWLAEDEKLKKNKQENLLGFKRNEFSKFLSSLVLLYRKLA